MASSSRQHLAASSHIDEWLGRVTAAGGKVLVPRTAIGGDMGCYAYFEDTEGNRVGLHGEQ